jgi:hypothetical protein
LPPSASVSTRIDLRTSSLTCISHYGVELRTVSSLSPRDLRRSSSPRHRRASRRSPVGVAVDVLTAYRGSTRGARARRSAWPLVHKKLQLSTVIRAVPPLPRVLLRRRDRPRRHRDSVRGRRRCR